MKIYNTKSPRLMKTISSLYSITQKPIWLSHTFPFRFRTKLSPMGFWTPHCRRFHRTFRRGRFSTDWSQCSTQMGRQQCREQPCHHYTISRTAPNIPHSSKTHVLLDKRYVGKIEKRNPIHRKQKFRYCQKNNRHDSNDGIQRLSRILCPTLWPIDQSAPKNFSQWNLRQR